MAKFPTNASRRPDETVSRVHRNAFIQTNGKQIFIYDADVETVTAVETEKAGKCLVLALRSGREIWIKDLDRHRWLLSMATNIDTAETLTEAGRPRS